MTATKLFTDEDFQYCVDIRRTIHQHPELGYDLPKTSALVKTELEKMGLTTTDRYAPCSVVSWINPGSSGKKILPRADMDALPVTEKTGLPYASKIEGRMHACGHDSHVAILLTVARVLSRVKDQLPCGVKLCFQPSEECEDCGAKRMMNNGVADDVDCCVAIHCDNDVPVGTIGVREGDFAAACDPIKITFHGKTAHATRPEQGIDAIQMALKAQAAMKKIVEEEVGERRYIWALCSFHGGTAHNIISDLAEIKISFRYYDMEFAARVRERCVALCQQLAAEVGGTVDIDWEMLVPPIHNEASLVEQFRKSISKLDGIGLKKVPQRISSDDFSWTLQKAPGFLFRYGTRNEEKGCTAVLHSNDFVIDEDGFRAGVLAFVQFVLDSAELVLSTDK